MSTPFRISRTVEFSDTDMAGIVHFANFFRYMEAAECAYLRACGLSVVTEWEGQKVSFPRVSASCDFLAPIRFQDVIEISVQIDKVGRSSVTYAFEVFKGDVVAARGRLTSVLCRVGAGHGLEAMEIPGPIREALLRGPDGKAER